MKMHVVANLNPLSYQFLFDLLNLSSRNKIVVVIVDVAAVQLEYYPFQADLNKVDVVVKIFELTH